MYTQTQWRTESTTHKTGKQSSPKQLDTQNEGGEKKVYFPQYTQICFGIHTHTNTHLVSRFLSTFGCWLGLKLLALLGWSPLDLGRVKLVL